MPVTLVQQAQNLKHSDGWTHDLPGMFQHYETQLSDASWAQQCGQTRQEGIGYMHYFPCQVLSKEGSGNNRTVVCRVENHQSGKGASRTC